MLKAARAQGRPMMVIAMITAATSQPNAIQAPPIRIQRMLRMMETGCMANLLGLRHTAQYRGGANGAVGLAFADERASRAPCATSPARPRTRRRAPAALWRAQAACCRW